MKLAKAKEYYELDLLKSFSALRVDDTPAGWQLVIELSLIHISEPTRPY